MMPDVPLPWLLDQNPALRWQVERDLADEPGEVWQATRANVATEGAAKWTAASTHCRQEPNMSVAEVDAWMQHLDDDTRAPLERLRTTILQAMPDAEQGLSYGVPVFLLAGARIAGFSAAKHHVSYLPHSGSVLAGFSKEDLKGFSASKGALKIPKGAELPDDLVHRLITARRAEAGV